MTDWQILNLYLLPAVRRAEEFERKTAAAENHTALSPNARAPLPPESAAPDFEPGTPGHRRQIVEMAFMGVMGMNRKAAESKYEQQLAEWRQQQAGGE